MAVTITDNRTIVDEADSITGWTGNSLSLFTTDPDPIETTGSLGIVVSTATQDVYFTSAARNLTNKLVYVWVFPRGAMDTTANGGISVHLGDGTNRIAFHLAGSDVAGFRHDSGPVGWYCLLLDTSNLPAAITVRAGTLVGLNLGAITQIGATFKTLAKSVGGSQNCFIDIMRICDPSLNDKAALTIIGGTSGDPGKFSEIAALDRSTGNQQAYGVIRELGAGLFGCQSSMRFGNPTGTASSWFEDTNTSVAFESRGLTTSRYAIAIRDNGVGTTTFKLGTKSGSGSTANGTDGCTITIPTGVGGEFDSQTDTNVTDVFLYGSVFTGFTNGFRMRTSQEFIGSSLVASGAFEPGGTTVTNSTITGSTAAAAVIVNSVAEMNNIINCTFTNNTNAIRINTAGTYTFDGLIFSGNTFDVENASTGLVTINATNGSTVATFTNTGAGATTVINNPKTFTVTNIIEDSEVRLIQVSGLTELAGVENVAATPTGINEVTVSADPNNAGRFRVSYAYNYSGDIPIFVVVFSLEYQPIYLSVTLQDQDSSLLVSQIGDRQYDAGSIP
jgi:hypothetical protein